MGKTQTYLRKAIPAFLACTTLSLGILNTAAPVYAKSTTSATQSGSTANNNQSNYQEVACNGSSLSGLDAQIFNSVAPALGSNQRLVCARSNGFNTEISGMNNIKNYHWTAWYKDKLDEKPDATQGNGNYHGFSADKVQDWKQYEDEIRELNGGKFPAVKEYKYPTDTKDGKLDFWGDIAGYYSVLGDPQYSYLTMKAYQHFSYTVETTNVEYGYTFESVPEKNNGGNKGNNGKGEKPNKKPSVGNTGTHKDPSGKGPTHACAGGSNSFFCNTYAPGSTNTEKDQWTGGWNGPVYYAKKGSLNGTVPRHTWDEKVKGGIKHHYEIITTSYSNGSVKALVAQANVAADAYATEIAAYGRVSLVPGSKGTLTYDVPHNKFWKVTPSYWTDGGKQTISNRSDLPYHFESEGSTSASQDDKAPNNVNLYAVIKQKDKLYSFIHGYPEIDEHPGDTDKTCVVTEKETCSKDETPLIEITIDITKDTVQDQKEIDKFVHLIKDKK